MPPTSKTSLSWLEDIRCPSCIDFEQPLTYESDEETDAFFSFLKVNPSRHQTRRQDQPLFPVSASLRRVEPVHSHRPKTSFEQFLREYNESRGERTPSPGPTTPRDTPNSRQSGARVPSIDTHSNPASSRSTSTPRRAHLLNGTPSPTDACTGTETPLKTPTLDSIKTPTSSSRPRRVATPGRRSKPLSPLFARMALQSPPKPKIAPTRRPRPPERVTPPAGPSIASVISRGNSHSGQPCPSIERGEGNSEGKVGPPMRVTRSRSNSPIEGEGSSIPADNLGREPSATKNCVRVGMGSASGRATRAEESAVAAAATTDFDKRGPEFFRMIEEHNRRLRRGQSRVENNPAEVSLERGSQDRRSHGPKCTNLNISNDPKDASGGAGHQHTATRLLSQGGLVSERTPADQSKEITGLDEEVLLTELLKSENDRVLEGRRKRNSEREKERQAKRNSVLRNFEGDLAARQERQSKRVSARVEFTSAKATQQSRGRVRGTGTSDAEPASIGTENIPPRDERAASQNRRAPQGFRARSRSTYSATRSGSSNAALKAGDVRMGPKSSRKVSNTATAKVKASARQERVEKRVELDLQSILSMHNKKVQRNKSSFVVANQ